MGVSGRHPRMVGGSFRRNFPRIAMTTPISTPNRQTGKSFASSSASSGCRATNHARRTMGGQHGSPASHARSERSLTPITSMASRTCDRPVDSRAARRTLMASVIGRRRVERESPVPHRVILTGGTEEVIPVALRVVVLLGHFHMRPSPFGSNNESEQAGLPRFGIPQQHGPLDGLQVGHGSALSFGAGSIALPRTRECRSDDPRRNTPSHILTISLQSVRGVFG